MSTLIYKNRLFFFFSFKGFICFIIHNLNALFGAIGLFSLAHIWMLVFGLGIVITKLSLVLMWQINEMLKQKFKFKRHNVLKFCYYVIQNLYFITKMQHNFGNVFVIFLIIECPINIVITMWILLGEIEQSKLFFICIFVVGQLFGIFICHFILTLYTKV